VALLISPFFFPYLGDNVQENRFFRNQISQLFQKNIHANLAPDLQFIHSPKPQEPAKIRIGYIASTLRKHSVGWLSRWLFHYHDRNSFHINLYLINQDMEDTFMQNFFRCKVDVTYTFRNEAPTIAKQIKDDEIDILIDLDSLTLDTGCQVMALKPAPIQVTWLGWDASGIPAIDYYIIDPYVLADNAQQYYSETLWRLPQTYVAVDGFEVGTPTLKRADLDIPDDAVTFFSAQVGYKRHPDTIKLQLQIIKEVPNSYFLIKGIGDKGIIRDYFGKLAEEVGVNPDRLRFVDRDGDELTHRANLGIADVVLDTYPYNGATTTLETLWMGIPMVTRVGEQFAARNSYTFMKNAGIEEGIAWTDEEYVEWGIRLGKDRALRWEIAGKLRASRQTSPLWNAKKFTQEMENAYRQMWAKYLS
jgi:predicted O-linked N-acetylglucosamine transferase (SPINDLY family)